MNELYAKLLDAVANPVEYPYMPVFQRGCLVALELHKPEFFGGHIACLACSPGMPPPVLVMWSDCETVKAIAEALGVTV